MTVRLNNDHTERVTGQTFTFSTRQTSCQTNKLRIDLMRHSHLAVIQQHAVHLLDGSIGGVLSLEVDEGVALGAILITHHLEQRRTQR